MIGLPQSTKISRPLPKIQLFKKFELKQSQRDAIDADIARMDFVNLIAPQTLPAIAEGNEVKAIFVIEVELKRKDFDHKSIGLIARLIPQRIVFALRFDDKVMLAVYHDKLFTSQWQPTDNICIHLSGINLDTVWQEIVISVGNMEIVDGNSLNEQIKINEEKLKLKQKIESLTRQMNTAIQPRRKRELFHEIQQLKVKLLYGNI